MEAQIEVVGGIFKDVLLYGNGLHATELLEMPGGTAYNVFLALNEVGVKCHFHGAVGNDWVFEKENIRIVPNAKSGLFVSFNEETTLAVYRGANLKAPREKITGNALFATLECGGNLFEYYAQEMKGRNGTVFLDPSPVFEWRKEFGELCDVLLPNESEFSSIGSLPEQIKIFLKMGTKGAKYIYMNEEKRIKIRKSGPYPLGCGDAFDAAVVYAYMKNQTASEMLEFAVSVSQNAAFVQGSSTAVVEALTDAIF